MGRWRKGLAAVGVAGVLGVLGAAPAGATETSPCGPLTAPVCEWVPAQIENALAQAEEAKDYAIYVGDRAVAIVNETYATIKCVVLQECS